MNSDGTIAEIRRKDASGVDAESWLYTYLGSGDPNAGLLQKVQFQQTNGSGGWNLVRQVAYNYYTNSSSSGKLGDLETATIEDTSGNTIDTSYYRYYTTESATGFPHGLKYVFDGESYARLAAVYSDPTTATDAQVAPYAQHYFEYDVSRRVTLHTVHGAGGSTTGGLGTFTYQYTTSSNADGVGSWTYKTIETLPDGNENIVYCNYLGEVILNVFSDSAGQWIQFYKYDSDGRMVLQAMPSAVTGYDETKADLLNSVSGNYQYLSDSSGLIYITDYYGSTTSGINDTTVSGGVAGYVEDHKVQNGELGTAILTDSESYFAHSAGTASLFPVAVSTAYGDVAGTDARTTTYSYGWTTGLIHPQSQTMIAPPIVAAQNGPASSTSDTADADTTTTVFDAYGHAAWIKDGDGFITYDQFDPLTGALLKHISDVKTSDTGDFSNKPSGWTTLTGGGLELITLYTVDALGRTTSVTDPDGNVTYMIYVDSRPSSSDGYANEVIVYPGWHYDGMHYTTTGPVQVTRDYRPAPGASSGQQTVYSETLTFTAPLESTSTPSGAETISASNIQRLSRTLTNAAGQDFERDDYSSLSGLTFSAASPQLASAAAGDRTQSGNYSATLWVYDSMGRLNRTVDPNGTITRSVFDGLGRVISLWTGTDDTPTTGDWSPSNTAGTNLMDVQDDVYDSGGVGDSNLTQVTNHVDTSSGDDRVSQYLFDFRDRLVAEKDGVQSSESDGTHRPITYKVLDNQGEALRMYRYDGDGVGLSDFAAAAATDAVPTADASDVRALTVNSFDDLGRAFRSQVFSIDQTNGTSGLTDSQILALPNLATDTFWNHRGNVMAVFAPGGQVTKYAFDGADRVQYQYVTDGGAVNNSDSPRKDWTDASSVADDVVLTETDNTFDFASNLILTATRERFNTDATSSMGALGSPSTGIGARVYYVADYYDLANRPTDEVNVGTNGGSAYTRPTSVPSASDTVLINHTDYDPAGNAYKLTDPRGIITQFTFDMLGRKTQEDQGASGSPAAGESITNWTYNAGGNVLTMQATFAGTSTPSQTTQYVYGIGGVSGAVLFSNDLLARIEYPIKTGTGAGSPDTFNPSDWLQYTYNLLGQTASMQDQNGNVHTYTHDVLGRLKLDAVTTLGSGVNNAVLALGFTYTALGLPFQQTSYSDSSGTTVVNQVQDVYNGYGQLTKQYQEHSGAVNTSSSLNVQYVYSQPTGANYSRLTAMIYPNGRQLDYVYNSGLDSDISRVSGLSDDGGSAAGNDQSYTYLGLNTIVQALDGNGIELTYIKQSGESNGDAGDQYIGLDRFGRVVDQRWIPTSSPSSPTDRFQYGYDRDGNVLYKNNLVNSTFSELYHANSTISLDNNAAYDNLNRLQSFSRGTLSASGNNGGGTGLDQVTTLNSLANSSQSYMLDALGNMTSVTTDGTSQSDSFNSQNEETAAGSTSTGFDSNGNTTTLGTVTLVYDAWNRLVRLHTSLSIVAIFTYDANGNRITNFASSTTTQLYNSLAGQALEERRSGTVIDQYVWGLMGINQLVLRDDASTGGSLGKSGSGLSRRLYVQQDADWSVTALVNGGTVQERFVYSPYGTRTALNASWSTAFDSLVSAYGFQGGRMEPTGGIGGLIHFGAREFSATLMRWAQPDPAGYIDGGNRYQAMGDSPATNVDPTGLCAEDPQAIRARINQTIQTLQSGNYGVADLQSLASDMRALGKSEGDIQMATAAFVSQLSGKINQDTADYQTAVNLVDGLGTRPAQFLTGYFVDAPVGLVTSALHPIQTAENLFNLVGAYYNDPRAVSDSILAQLQDPRGQGAFLGNLAWGWATGKAIAGLVPAGPVAEETSFIDQMEPAEAARYQEYWSQELNGATRQRYQVAPGYDSITDVKISGRTGETYLRQTLYDEYGRAIGVNDFTDHGEPLVHEDPHYHTIDPLNNNQRSGPIPGLHPATPGN